MDTIRILLMQFFEYDEYLTQNIHVVVSEHLRTLKR